MGIGAVLQELLNANQTNVNAVSIATGVSPSTLYSIIKRDNMKASINDLYKIAHYLGVDLDYFGARLDSTSFLNPAPSPQSLSADEQQLVENYRALNEQGQELVRQQMELIVLSDKYKNTFTLPTWKSKRK